MVLPKEPVSVPLLLGGKMVYELEMAESLSEIAKELKAIREALEAKNATDEEILSWVSEIGDHYSGLNSIRRKKECNDRRYGGIL